ncbi:hypothetical protein COLO4_16479 [Corchorus olitorius]|uniref:Reverse transcriptase zinc-binding domain-containing protein n=1 Tax=Corchorus olitorius TaxID=93759 RepID=A0A1R3JH79_9ROSI|nr:hypothetical protein COLO4_16479 [Corchorus olitorius]
MGRGSGSSRPRKSKRNSKKHKRPVVIKEHQESPSENNAPNTAQAPPQTQPIAEGHVINDGAPPARDDQVQQVDNQMKANSNNVGRHNNPAYVGRENPNPNFHQEELVSSPAGSTNETTTNNAIANHPNGAGGDSNQQIRQPAFQANIIEGTDSSHGEEEAVAAPPPAPAPPPPPPPAQQTGMSTPFSPLIMEQLNPFPMALAEKIPENANCGGGAQSSCHSENEVTSKAANENHGHVGSSSQAELSGSRRQTLDRGKAIMTADHLEIEQNNIGNNNFSGNQEALPPYPSLFPQTPSEMGFFNGGSSQFNQQLPNWTSNTGNDLYRPMPPSGSEINPFNATNSSGPMCFNFMLPQSPAVPLRPTQFNNPLQPMNQVPNMPNATDSALLQHSGLPSNPMPMHMPQHFSHQPDQAQMAPGAYNPQNFTSMLPESSVPLSLRTPMLPTADKINPLDTSDLHYRYNSLQPKPNMLPRYFFFFFFLSISQPLAPYQQVSNQFSMLPPLPNSDTNYQNSVLPSLLPRLPTVKQPTLNQTTSRPTPIYPRSGNYLPTLVFNSLLQAENGGNISPYRVENSLSNLGDQQEIGGRRGRTRRFEVGESSSFKRFRIKLQRDPNAASSSQQVTDTSLSLKNNEATAAEHDIANLQLGPPRIWCKLFFQGLQFLDYHLIGSQNSELHYGLAKFLDDVLANGPWSVMGCSLNLRRWEVGHAIPNLDFSNIDFWIQGSGSSMNHWKGKSIAESSNKMCSEAGEIGGERHEALNVDVNYVVINEMDRNMVTENSVVEESRVAGIVVTEVSVEMTEDAENSRVLYGWVKELDVSGVDTVDHSYMLQQLIDVVLVADSRRLNLKRAFGGAWDELFLIGKRIKIEKECLVLNDKENEDCNVQKGNTDVDVKGRTRRKFQITADNCELMMTMLNEDKLRSGDDDFRANGLQKVEETIDKVDKKWVSEKLDGHVSEEECRKIERIPIGDTLEDDRLIWPSNKDGEYSVKSSYKVVKGKSTKRVRSGPSSSYRVPDSVWKVLWSLKVPNRVRIFLWKACKAFLAAGHILWRRHLQDTPICPCCGEFPETVEHALLLCEWVQPIWFGSILYIRIQRDEVTTFDTYGC